MPEVQHCWKESKLVKLLCPSPLSLGEQFSWHVPFYFLFFFPPAISIPKLSPLSVLLSRIPQKAEPRSLTWWSFNSRWQWAANLNQLASCSSCIAAVVLVSDKLPLKLSWKRLKNQVYHLSDEELKKLLKYKKLAGAAFFLNSYQVLQKRCCLMSVA